jgi:glyoxylase-like metal-dependent hydrolase (beta-lactamase superfamily II)
MIAFIKSRSQAPIRYLIITHHHSDHSNGAYLFPEAEVLSHPLCRKALTTLGVNNLEQAKRETPGLAEVEIRPPGVVSEYDTYVHLGVRSLHVMPLPGHSNDSIGVMVEGDKMLFAGDAMLPLPYFGWGSLEDTVRSLRTIRALRPESVAQGHGQLLLRGELAEEIDSSLRYLEAAQRKVRRLVRDGEPESAVLDIDIESCGKSRLPLDGLVQFLHRENLHALYATLAAETGQSNGQGAASRL